MRHDTQDTKTRQPTDAGHLRVYLRVEFYALTKRKNRIPQAHRERECFLADLGGECTGRVSARTCEERLLASEPATSDFVMPAAEAPQSQRSQTQDQAAALLQLMRMLYALAAFVRASAVLKLLACILVDIIGYSSYLLPGVGEMGDVAWAPLQAGFLMFMFSGQLRVAALGFMEEILPGLDFVPTACMAWACENIDMRELDFLRRVIGVPLRTAGRSD